MIFSLLLVDFFRQLYGDLLYYLNTYVILYLPLSDHFDDLFKTNILRVSMMEISTTIMTFYSQVG